MTILLLFHCLKKLLIFYFCFKNNIFCVRACVCAQTVLSPSVLFIELFFCEVFLLKHCSTPTRGQNRNKIPMKTNSESHPSKFHIKIVSPKIIQFLSICPTAPTIFFAIFLLISPLSIPPWTSEVQPHRPACGKDLWGVPAGDTLKLLEDRSAGARKPGGRARRWRSI